MTNKRQQLNYLQYQYIYSIYYKLLCLQYFQNLSSVIRILSSELNTGITAWLYNQNNQLLNSVDNQFTYDANGNQVEEKDSSGQLQKQYIYNTENRLSEIKDANGQTIASYYYDPFGRRLSKAITDQGTATTTTTYFHYNDEGYSAEKTNGQITSYLFSPQQTWSTNPILKRENDIYYYYQNDHLGTPNILHDKQGQVVNAREMQAFGQWTNSTSVINDNFAFAGQYRDAETGSYYNFHRDYNPNVGRYIESDPIGLGGGFNVFTYSQSNALRYNDDQGLITLCGSTPNPFSNTCIPIPWPLCIIAGTCRTPPDPPKSTPTCKGKWVKVRVSYPNPLNFWGNLIKKCYCHWSCYGCEGSVFLEYNYGQEETSGTRAYSGRGDIKNGKACNCDKPSQEEPCEKCT